MTLSDRKNVEKCLAQGVSFAEIGRRLIHAPGQPPARKYLAAPRLVYPARASKQFLKLIF
ncbi:hypothetical protein [Pyramidobacter sp. C12-8]|uniref:hypothetical protein n=1 Tax=Pyramidobacter sp. C12-8 TaxID=1943580 RepID=UPI00406D2E85